jgi:iron-sulfur cluster assembly accessory protein
MAIHISPKAAEKIKALIDKEGGTALGLRVGIKGAGCSGLAYNMSLAEKEAPRDKIFEGEGVKLFIDPKSYIFLNGTTLEYHEGLMSHGFKFQNPNAKGGCGCGESFTV